MSKDRIKDLQKPLRNDDVQSIVNDGGIQFTTIKMDKEYNVPEFLLQIDLIRLLVDKIEEFAKEIEQIHKKMIEPMADPKLAQELDDKTADIKKLAYDISTKLQKMEQVQEDQDDTEKQSAQWRIKELQIFNITRRFREVMNQYNQEFVSHRERCKRNIMRELEITGNRKSNDELEEMLENGFPGTFNFSIMVDIEKARQAVNEIEARHRDITRLETTVKELHSMFADLARLVAIQGEMIDNIEHNVSKAAEYVGQAVEVVHQAGKSRKADMKKRFILCIILASVVLILALIFAAYYATQKQIIGK